MTCVHVNLLMEFRRRTLGMICQHIYHDMRLLACMHGCGSFPIRYQVQSLE